jgi:hypothetical protein
MLTKARHSVVGGAPAQILLATPNKKVVKAFLVKALIFRNAH